MELQLSTVYLSSSLLSEGRGAVKVAVVFYSMFGHMFKMSQAALEGAESLDAEAKLLRIPETLSPEVLGAMGAVDAQKSW